MLHVHCCTMTYLLSHLDLEIYIYISDEPSHNLTPCYILVQEQVSVVCCHGPAAVMVMVLVLDITLAPSHTLTSGIVWVLPSAVARNESSVALTVTWMCHSVIQSCR